MRNQDNHNEQRSGNGSFPGRNDNINRRNTFRDEFIARRRRYFLLLSIFPFVISAMALCIMLAVNAPSRDPLISNLESSAVSLRGKNNGKETASFVETSDPEDSGAAPHNNFVSNNQLSSSSSSISPSPMASVSVADNSQSAFESTLFSTTTTLPPTFKTTTRLSQNSHSSSSSVPASKVAVETTTHAPSSPTSHSTSIFQDTTTTARTTTATTKTSTTAQHECEEAITREQCRSNSNNCVWFVPVNWSELCFSKPSFPLSRCKEVRLAEECLQSVMGCLWSIEKRPGRDDDICRFSTHSELRGKQPKRPLI